jgi:hypothetical protein
LSEFYRKNCKSTCVNQKRKPNIVNLELLFHLLSPHTTKGSRPNIKSTCASKGFYLLKFPLV